MVQSIIGLQRKQYSAAAVYKTQEKPTLQVFPSTAHTARDKQAHLDQKGKLSVTEAFEVGEEVDKITLPIHTLFMMQDNKLYIRGTGNICMEFPAKGFTIPFDKLAIAK